MLGGYRLAEKCVLATSVKNARAGTWRREAHVM